MTPALATAKDAHASTGGYRSGNGREPNGRFARLTGCGMCVPERILSNEELARAVDTTDEWIVSHTGIKERRVAHGEKETTASLAVRAARQALLAANLPPGQLDLVIVATATPEYTFPSTASLVQNALGATHAGAFDLSAGCSGFIYALTMASSAVRSGSADHVLVVGAETLSRITDWSDRNTCVLFGDGAGAVVVSASPDRCGVLATLLGSDGAGGDLLILPAGGSHAPASHETVSGGGHYIKMNGREVYRFATTVMPKATETVAEKAGWSVADLNLVIPHQANMRIIESAAKRLALPLEKFFVNLDRYGNTSAASIPIALAEAIAAGRVHPGDKLVLVGFGAGLTWAAAAIEWGAPVPMRRASWLRRLITRVRFVLASLRSGILHGERRIYDVILGPEGREDWRSKLRERADRLRSSIGRKADEGG